MVSAQEIRVVAELLQISPESLQKAITYKVTVRTKLLTLLMQSLLVTIDTFTKTSKKWL